MEDIWGDNPVKETVPEPVVQEPNFPFNPSTSEGLPKLETNTTTTQPETNIWGDAQDKSGTETSPTIASDISIQATKNKPYDLLDYSPEDLAKSPDQLKQEDKLELLGAIQKYGGTENAQKEYQNQVLGKKQEDEIGTDLAETMARTENLTTLFGDNPNARQEVIDRLSKEDPSFKAYKDDKTGEWFYTSQYNKDPRPFDSTIMQTALANKWAIGAGIIAGLTLPFALPAMGVGATGTAIGTALGSTAASTASGLGEQQAQANKVGVELSPEDRLAKAGVLGTTSLVGEGLGKVITKFASAFKNGFEAPKLLGIAKNMATSRVQTDVDNALSNMSTSDKKDLLNIIQTAKDKYGIDVPISSLDSNSFIATFQKVASRNPLIGSQLKEDIEKSFPQLKSSLDTILVPKEEAKNWSKLSYDEQKQALVQMLNKHRTQIKEPIQAEYNKLAEEGKDISIPIKDIVSHKSDLVNKLDDVIKATEGANVATSIRTPLRTVLDKLQKTGSIDTKSLSDMLSTTNISHISDLTGIPSDILTSITKNIPKGSESEYLSKLGTNAISDLQSAIQKKYQGQTSVANRLGININNIASKQAEELNNLKQYEGKLNTLGKQLIDSSPSNLTANDLMEIHRYLRQDTGNDSINRLFTGLRSDIMNTLEDTAGGDYATRLKQANLDYRTLKNTLESDATSGRAIQANLERILSSTKGAKDQVLPHYGKLDELFSNPQTAVNNARELSASIRDLPEGQSTLNKLADNYMHKFITSTAKNLSNAQEIEHFKTVFGEGIKGAPTGINMDVMKELLPADRYKEFETLTRISTGMTKAFDNISKNAGFVPADTNPVKKLMSWFVNKMQYIAVNKLINAQTVEDAIIKNLQSSPHKEELLNEFIKQKVVPEDIIKRGAVGTILKSSGRLESTREPTQSKASTSKSYQFINKGVQ